MFSMEDVAHFPRNELGDPRPQSPSTRRAPPSCSPGATPAMPVRPCGETPTKCDDGQIFGLGDRVHRSEGRLKCRCPSRSTVWLRIVFHRADSVRLPGRRPRIDTPCKFPRPHIEPGYYSKTLGQGDVELRAQFARYGSLSVPAQSDPASPVPPGAPVGGSFGGLVELHHSLPHR